MSSSARSARGPAGAFARQPTGPAPDVAILVEQGGARLAHPLVDEMQVAASTGRTSRAAGGTPGIGVGLALGGVVIDDVPVVQHAGQGGCRAPVNEEIVAADGVGRGGNGTLLVHPVKADVVHVDAHRVDQRSTEWSRRKARCAGERLLDQLPLLLLGGAGRAQRLTMS